MPGWEEQLKLPSRSGLGKVSGDGLHISYNLRHALARFTVDRVHLGQEAVRGVDELDIP